MNLGLKPLKKIEEYWKLDKKIVRCYNQMVVAEQDVERLTNIEWFQVQEDVSLIFTLLFPVCTFDVYIEALEQQETNNSPEEKVSWTIHSLQKLCETPLAEECHDVEKIVVSVDLLCSKCRKKVMKLIAEIEGITSVVLDPSKNTATIIGETDPVKLIKMVRKFRKSAAILSIGPPKDEKKDGVYYPPKTCQKCDVWYVISEDAYNYCSIM